MRIATLHSASTAFDGIQARQAEQARLQTQLSTGLRVVSPKDDPVAAAQAELARSRLARLTQDQRANAAADSLLSSADNALAQGTDLLQSIQETLVAAGDGAYNASDRQQLAQSLRAAREQMLAIANSRDPSGGYVFSGQGSEAAPVSSSSSPAYGAAAGTQRIGEGGRYVASVDGRASFMSIPQGNGVFVTASGGGNTGTGSVDTGSVIDATKLTGHDYSITISGTPGNLQYSVADLTSGTAIATNVAFTAGASIDIDGQRLAIAGTPSAGDTFSVKPAGQQSIFETLDQAIAVLEQPLSPAAYSEQLQRVQAGVDRALDRVLTMRTQIGEELRSVGQADSGNQQQELSVKERRKNLEEVDVAAAISAAQNNQVGLEAALKSYTSLSKLSLIEML
jgi:flagellar hook-associated protein 3 FlgL